jgi:hypothetical protein
MWVRKSSIRPVPSFARIDARTLDGVRAELLSEGPDTQDVLDDAFERFDASQPALSQKLGVMLARPLGETSLALGYFLCLSVWMAFERRHGLSLGVVSAEELDATEQLLSLDEDLRKSDPHEHLETDDVVAMEQPDLVRFIQEHLEATLDAHGDSVELEELQAIYRMVLVEMLALSHAVRPPLGYPVSRGEVVA